MSSSSSLSALSLPKALVDATAAAGITTSTSPINDDDEEEEEGKDTNDALAVKGNGSFGVIMKDEEPIRDVLGLCIALEIGGGDGDGNDDDDGVEDVTTTTSNVDNIVGSRRMMDEQQRYAIAVTIMACHLLLGEYHHARHAYRRYSFVVGRCNNNSASPRDGDIDIINIFWEICKSMMKLDTISTFAIIAKAEQELSSTLSSSSSSSSSSKEEEEECKERIKVYHQLLQKIEFCIRERTLYNLANCFINVEINFAASVLGLSSSSNPKLVETFLIRRGWKKKVKKNKTTSMSNTTTSTKIFLVPPSPSSSSSLRHQSGNDVVEETTTTTTKMMEDDNDNNNGGKNNNDHHLVERRLQQLTNAVSFMECTRFNV